MIVSYDGTANDDDALALGKMLGLAGMPLALAYVRHSQEFDPRREQLAQHDAERRLEQAVAWLGIPETPTHVVFSASTGEGLVNLASTIGASLIVFGSDYRTPPGHAEPGGTAQHLLEGGPVAVAIAAAGLRAGGASQIRSIMVQSPDRDQSVRETAESLAGKLGAELVGEEHGPADLIVVGSQAAAPEGRIALSGSTRSMLNSATGSVLVVPNGRPVVF